MITVYIWTDGVGHAAMKIARQGGTKYYSWWPAGAAGPLNPRGRAEADSAGAGHPRRNPIAYGQSKLDTTVDEATRKVTVGAHHPGGAYGYNRSDKDMEEGSANLKFFFRPSSGLDAEEAEKVFARHFNKSTGKGDYHFLKNNCSHVVLKALQAAVLRVQPGAGRKPPSPSPGIIQPATVVTYCTEWAKILNNDQLRWSDAPQPTGYVMGRRGPPPVKAPPLPPVIKAIGKGEVNRYVDPSRNDSTVEFTQMARHEAHP